MRTSVTASITTIRAVGVELLWQLLKPLLISGGIVAIGLITFGGWLTTQHALWWILEIIFISSTMLFILLAIITRVILKILTPQQNIEQRKAIQAFVDKLQRISDTIGISRFVLFFRIVRDIIWPREQTFIKQIADDSATLHTDFIKLQKLFNTDKV